MLTISKPLSAAQVKAYHAEEFSDARTNYYTAGDQIRGLWHGQLARQWGATVDVQHEQYERRTDGQHPLTAEPLVRQQTARTYTNARGEQVTPLAHPPGREWPS